MSFNTPKCKAYSDIAFRLLIGASGFGAFWLLIFSICQGVKS